MDGTFDHVMIRVEDLEESLDWYQTHLNYEEKGRWEADTFTNVYLGPEEMHEDGATLELTYNHGDNTYGSVTRGATSPCESPRTPCRSRTIS